MARTSRRINKSGPGATADNSLACLNDSCYIPPAVYLADGYVRLSDKDAGKSVSDSVRNQSRLIDGYAAAAPDIKLNRIIVDDGKTGTNFNRSGFQMLMRDIQEGCVSCVIVKDLSRLGRDYVETGRLLEQTFPGLGVRFIAILDQYDSLDADDTGSSFLVPIKNVTNQEYSAELSEKVKSAKRLSMEEGKNVMPLPPYGYDKSDGRLVKDPYAADVVRKICRLVLDKNSLRSVCRQLEKERIPPPKKYFFEKGLLKSERYREQVRWHTTTIKRLLLNDILLGDTVQGRYESPYLRAASRIRPDRREWFITEDTHEALISRKERIQLEAILNRETGKEGQV